MFTQRNHTAHQTHDGSTDEPDKDPQEKQTKGKHNNGKAENDQQIGEHGKSAERGGQDHHTGNNGSGGKGQEQDCGHKQHNNTDKGEGNCQKDEKDKQRYLWLAHGPHKGGLFCRLILVRNLQQLLLNIRFFLCFGLRSRVRSSYLIGQRKIGKESVHLIDNTPGNNRFLLRLVCRNSLPLRRRGGGFSLCPRRGFLRNDCGTNGLRGLVRRRLWNRCVSFGNKIVKQAELIFIDCRFQLLIAERIAAHLVDGQDKVSVDLRSVFVAALGMDLKLTFFCVIGAGNGHGLPGGRCKSLQQCLLIPRFVKHAFVHGKGFLPVLLIHEGQQPCQFGKKFLFVDIGHLRLYNRQYYMRCGEKGQAKTERFCNNGGLCAIDKGP